MPGLIPGTVSKVDLPGTDPREVQIPTDLTEGRDNSVGAYPVSHSHPQRLGPP